MTDDIEQQPEQDGFYYCYKCNPKKNFGTNIMALKHHNLTTHLFDDMKDAINKIPEDL